MKDRILHFLLHSPAKVYLICVLTGLSLVLSIYYVRIKQELKEIDKDFITELVTESEFLDERFFLINEQLKNISEQAQKKFIELTEIEDLKEHSIVNAWQQSSKNSFIYDVSVAKERKAQIFAVKNMSLTEEQQDEVLLPIELVFSYEISQSLPSLYLTSTEVSSVYYVSNNAITAIYPNVDKVEFLNSLSSKYEDSINLPFVTNGREIGVMTNEPFLTSIYVDPLTESEVLTLGVPIWIKNKHIGNIGLDFKLDDLSRALNAIDKGLTATLFFADGSQISSTPTIELTEEQLNQIIEHNDKFGSVAVGGHRVYFSKTLDNKAALLSYIPLSERLWMAIELHITFMAAVFGLGIVLLWFGWISIGSSMKKMQASLEHLDNLANIDELTQISNRRYFQDCVSHQYASSCHKDAPVALILMDIDHFKKVNDAHGHLVGDEVLKQFCTVVSSCIRHSDLFARWGGEEFIILPSSVNNVFELSEKIRKTVFNYNFDHVGQVTVSIGSVYCENASEYSKKAIFEMADKAVYIAKRLGRNRVISEEV